MKIVADIGGTNSRFAIYESGRLNDVSIYPTRAFECCLDLIGAYLKDKVGGHMDGGASIAIGVAATVEDVVARGVNLPWDVDRNEIKRAFQFKEVILLNDFEATAWGVTGLGPKYLLPIGSARPRPTSNISVLGAGTGLGEALIVPCPSRKGLHVIPTEGGHADFSPSSEQEWRLFNFLKNRYGHVSVERILSGPGITDTYEFISGKRLTPQEITELALRKRHGDAIQCLEIFIKNYAKEAANLALKSLSFGGVYIAGGIAPKIKEAFSLFNFRQTFEDKGRMSPILKEIPVFICLHPHLGLLGAGIRLDRGPT